MSLWRRLFHDGLPKEAIANGTIAAYPNAMVDFGPNWMIRCLYSPDPAIQTDQASLHRAAADGMHERVDDWKGEFNRLKPFCKRIPPTKKHRHELWLRDFVVSGQVVPDVGQFLEMDALWIVESGKAAVTLAEPVPRNDRERQAYRLARIRKRKCQLVRAALVMANVALFEPGSEDMPCSAVFSFDDDLPERRLLAIAEDHFAQKNTAPESPVLAELAARITDERAIWDDRYPIPEEVCGIDGIYCASLFVHRPHLPDGHLDGRILTCLAEPGPRGMIVHVAGE